MIQINDTESGWPNTCQPRAIFFCRVSFRQRRRRDRGILV